MRAQFILKNVCRVIGITLIFGLAFQGSFTTLQAASLTSGSVSLSDSRPSQSSVTYTITVSNVTTSSIQCIQAVFSNAATSGTVPTGMVTTGAALSGTSTYIPTPASWTVNAAVNGTVNITYGTGQTPASASNRTIVLTGITNGSTPNTNYFVRFKTFTNTDCSTGELDSTTLSYIFTDGQVTQAIVNPSLTFTVSGVASGQTVNGATTNVTTSAGSVPLGVVTSSTNAIAAQDLAVGTNAAGGYSLKVKYTQQLTYNAETIDNHSGTNASPTSFSAAGTESFGYTTNDSSLSTAAVDRFTSSGGNKWAAFSDATAEEVAYNSGPASETTRLGYQVGVSSTTAAGTYSTVIILQATPVY